MYDEIISFIKELYPDTSQIPLHAPVFTGNEKKYVNECIDSTFVSSVGAYVNKFEDMICQYTGAKYSIATTNGTSALHMSLLLVGVEANSEVLTQALTFVATANAISYIGASPVFIDSSIDNLGMCPESLEHFLEENAYFNGEFTINKFTKRKISACVPMHVFGHPVKIRQIKILCDKYKIALVEDSAESLGSFTENSHTGLDGIVGILSFNGNKIVTCGGGGMIITNSELIAKKAKHLTTTAKCPHKWEFYHDEVGYNYRLPNLNAALACAQMELLPSFIENKRNTAKLYKEFFSRYDIPFIDEPNGAKSNYWLNAIRLKNKSERDVFLNLTNNCGIMTRPIWKLMTDLPAFKNSLKMPLVNAQYHQETIVNLPSSVRGLS